MTSLFLRNGMAAFAIVGLLFVGAGCTPTPVVQNPVEVPSENEPVLDAKIRVTAPVKDAVVTSPLVVSGTARGTWYFEASFPVKLLDANGKVLAVAPAQAQGEWMTEEFVPFSVTLTFAKPTTATGTLVLEKDNPSGLPEHANSRTIPVKFE